MGWKVLQVVSAGALVAGLLVVGEAHSVAGSDAPSSGWNDWDCRPSQAHPNPVVLLHGLGGNGDGWDTLPQHLVRNGYCVFSLTYGQAPPIYQIGGTGPLAESALEIAGFLDQVLAATGAAQADLVGHSLGGVLALYVPKVLSRADDVGKVVTMGTDPHGDGLLTPARVIDLLAVRPVPELLTGELGCQACTDVLPGSAFRQELSDGPVAQPGVSYTLIHTRLDEVIVTSDPLGSPFLEEPGVTNTYVQDECPLNLIEHARLPSDPTVVTMVANALDPDHQTRVPCSLGLPLLPI